jgi:DNA phosphorothioation-dependent restriction protein DptG
MALAEALSEDDDFASKLDAGASAVAALYFSRRRPPSKPVSVDQLVEIGTRRPGLFALREAITARRRTGLRNLSRDVVNQLLKRDRGALIRTRGRATFFEMDEDLLFLLVKLICQDDQVDFGSFLGGLREYGLVPQDEQEEHLLIGALESMGMLRRYADAGESIYVSHPIS